MLVCRSVLVLNWCNGEIIALDNPIKLLNHGIFVRLWASFVIVKVVNVVRVARSIHFKSLKEGNELLEVWLTIDSKDIDASYSSRCQITDTDDQQVDNVLEESPFWAECLQRIDVAQIELLG